jgi:hypothetical protein
MWTLGFNNWLILLWQQYPQPKVFCSCRSDLHNNHDTLTIPLYKTVSVQEYSWDVWCELLSSGHATASQSGWGQDSDRATPEGVFSSVEAILLLIYFGFGFTSVFWVDVLLYHRTSNWASIGRQIALHYPAKCTLAGLPLLERLATVLNFLHL